MSVFVLAFAIGCNPMVKVSNQNLADIYKPDRSNFNTEIRIQHINDSLSQCFVKVFKNEFLYIKPALTRNFCAQVRISIEIFPGYNDNTLIDSTSVLIIDSVQNPSELSIISSCFIRTPPIFKGIARITVRDINKKTSQQFFQPITKDAKTSAQYYRIENLKNELRLSNILHKNDTIRVFPLFQSGDSLSVKYYRNTFEFPTPPFVLENIFPIKLDPDSVFSISGSVEEGFAITLAKEGIYFIQTSDTCSDGLCLLSMGNGYPGVISPEQMLPPLRYITTQKEYDRISENIDLRSAIDEFWLSIGGNPERARNLIALYYNRVIEANNYFTSYTEGWKTDRGMAYIIFGSPNILYRNDEGEYWVYGEERNFYSITLQFVKMQNPFTENDYQLQRAPIYKDNWYRAVDLWRQ